MRILKKKTAPKEVSPEKAALLALIEAYKDSPKYESKRVALEAQLLTLE